MIVLIPCRCDGTAAETPQIREHFFEGNENCRETRKSRPKTKREKKKKKKVADEDEKCVGKNKVVPERRVHSDGFAELALEKTLNTRAQKTKEADQNSDTVIFSLSRLGASVFFAVAAWRDSPVKTSVGSRSRLGERGVVYGRTGWTSQRTAAGPRQSEL